jgi:hypothetical protein
LLRDTGEGSVAAGAASIGEESGVLVERI